jgi:hypothetical protein
MVIPGLFSANNKGYFSVGERIPLNIIVGPTGIPFYTVVSGQIPTLPPIDTGNPAGPGHFVYVGYTVTNPNRPETVMRFEYTVREGDMTTQPGGTFDFPRWIGIDNNANASNFNFETSVAGPTGIPFAFPSQVILNQTAVQNIFQHIRLDGTTYTQINRTGLLAAIEEAESKQANAAAFVQNASWTRMLNTLNTARITYNNEGAIQAQIDAAEANLRIWIAAVEEVTVVTEPDRTGLIEAIELAEAKIANADAYVQNASWTRMLNTLGTARSIYNNINATQAQIDAAETNLRTWMDSVIEIELPAA